MMSINSMHLKKMYLRMRKKNKEVTSQRKKKD